MAVLERKLEEALSGKKSKSKPSDDGSSVSRDTIVALERQVLKARRAGEEAVAQQLEEHIGFWKEARSSSRRGGL